MSVASIVLKMFEINHQFSMKTDTNVSDFPKRLILFGIWMERILEREILRNGAMGDELELDGLDRQEEGAAVTFMAAVVIPTMPGMLGMLHDGIDE
jgi:hypothetical protein